MKVTGIEIGEYRQFKNIKFDFTYPEGHSKAGQPMEKICFIGQSGTGKTTLLNIVWDLFQIINDGYQFHHKREFNQSINSYNTFKNKIKVRLAIGNRHVKFPPMSSKEVTLNENNFINWFRYNNMDGYVHNHNKFCIFIKDSIGNEAEAFLIDQDKALQSFADIVKTDTEIDQEKSTKKDRINAVDFYRVINLGERKSMDVWRYLLRDIFEYDDMGRIFARNIIHESSSLSVNSLIDKLMHWKKETLNPRVNLAEACLNPILKHFFLETDTENAEVPVVIKTRQGVKIDSIYLSAGIRQLLATAIPIYKFDTNGAVILFDEPERSLFPDIQRTLVKYYTSLAPEAQFFFATHSPIIASAFEPCERFILYFDENGEVKCRNGVAPIGDDPNDILSEDFGLNELMLDEGLEAYDRYRNLAVAIRNEKDSKRKDELIVERAKLGDQYKF